MATHVTEERIELTAVDKFSQVLGQAERGFKGLGSSIDTVKSAAAALGVTLGAGAVVAMYKDVINATAALDDMAEQTGATVEGLSKMQTVAKIGGHEFGGMADAMQKMIKGLKGADEEGQAAGQALDFLGVKAKDANGRFRDTAEIMQDVAKALAKYEDGGNKVALVQDLLGKGGARYLSMLKDMAEEGALQAKVTADQAAEAEKLEKNFNRLKIAGEDFARGLAMEWTPAIAKFTEELVQAQKAAGNLLTALLLVARGRGSVDETNAEIAAIEGKSGLRKFMENGATMGYAGMADQARLSLLYRQRDYQVGLLGNNARGLEDDLSGTFRGPSAPGRLNYESAVRGGKAAGGRSANADAAVREAEFIARKQVELEEMAAQDSREAWEFYTKGRLADEKKIQDEKDRYQKELERAMRKWAEEDERQNEKRIREFERTSDIIEHSLTDALMRGFESGKSFAENFRNVLVDMFKTLVLRPIIQPIAQAGAGALLGAFGGAANAAGGGGMGFTDIASMGSNLYSAFSGNSLIGNIGSAFGLGGGVLSSTAVAGEIAALTGSGVAVGGALGTGAVAASSVLPWVGGALAVGSALGIFGGGGIFGKKKKKKPADMYLSRDANGRYYIWGDDVPGPSARSDFAYLEAALNDPLQYDQDMLAGFEGQNFRGGVGERADSLLPKFLQHLAPAREAATAKVTAFQTGISGYGSSIDTLKGWQQSMLTSEYLSPLERLSGAKSIFDEISAKALAGDAAAIQQLGGASNQYAAAGRSVYASGQGFQDIWSQINNVMKGSLQSSQASFETLVRETPAAIQTAAAEQIAALREGFSSMVEAFDRLGRDIRQGKAA